MAQFPCPRERVAASALLLLSTMPPLPSSSSSSSMFVFEFKDEESNLSSDVRGKIKSWSGSGSLFSTDSKSCDSSISSDLSTEEISTRSTRIVSVASGRTEMKFKALRKNRSKILKSSNRWKFSSGASSMMTFSASGSRSADISCQSSSTICSADSSAGRRFTTFGKGRTYVGSAHIRRRADGILNLLSDGCYSEVRIRQVLGDSPDTSKALRMLLKLEEVKRSGTGGRQDPYIYKIASHHIVENRDDLITYS